VGKRWGRGGRKRSGRAGVWKRGGGGLRWEGNVAGCVRGWERGGEEKSEEGRE